MKQNTVYSKKILFIIRYIALATLLLLTYTTIEMLYYLIKKDLFSSYSFSGKLIEIAGIINNLIVIVFAAILIKQPQRFFLIGIGSLLYSVPMSLINSDAYMSLLMLFVAFSTGILRLHSSKHKKQYILIFTFIYLFELIIPITKGFEQFIDYAVLKVAITLILFIIVFFFYEFAKQEGIKEGVKDKILNLGNYKGIDRSDLFLLQDILDNKKYKEIAQKLHGSEGALRNKLSRIYKILEVGDRTGFLTIYSGYKLIFEPENNI